MPSIHLDKVIQSRAHLLYLVTGVDDLGLEAYYYVLVDREKVQQFNDAFDKPDMDLIAFGKIVESGYGQMPPEALQLQMKAKYM